MLESLVFVRVMEGLSLAVGLSIAYYALKAYSTSKHRPMISLATAFLLLTLGAMVEGFLFEVLHFDLIDARTFRSAIMLAGFVAVLYSIHESK